MNITVYKKSGCPWAAAVIGFLKQLDVPFEQKNMTTHRRFAEEAMQKAGKVVSPTVEIDDQVLADASVEDVAKVLEKRGVPV